jgi:hypothetical protein
MPQEKPPMVVVEPTPGLLEHSKPSNFASRKRDREARIAAGTEPACSGRGRVGFDVGFDVPTPTFVVTHVRG